MPCYSTLSVSWLQAFPSVLSCEMLGLGLRGPNPALSAARCRGLPTGGGRARCRAGGGGPAPSASSRFLLAPNQPHWLAPAAPVPVATAESSLQFPRHSQNQLPGAPQRHQHPLSSTHSTEIGVPATRSLLRVSKFA